MKKKTKKEVEKMTLKELQTHYKRTGKIILVKNGKLKGLKKDE